MVILFIKRISSGYKLLCKLTKGFEMKADMYWLLTNQLLVILLSDYFKTE